MLRDLSLYIAGPGVTTLLEKALYKKFDERLFIDVVDRMLTERRFRKVCATIRRFSEFSSELLNLKYKRVFLKAQASLGYLPPRKGRKASLLEIVKEQPRFSRVAFTRSA